jgi:hypothetical protein
MNFLPGMRLKNRLQTNLQRFLKASSVFDSDGAVDVIGLMQVRKPGHNTRCSVQVDIKGFVIYF